MIDRSKLYAIEIFKDMDTKYYLVPSETMEEAIKITRSEFPGWDIKNVQHQSLYAGIVYEGNNPKEVK